MLNSKLSGSGVNVCACLTPQCPLRVLLPAERRVLVEQRGHEGQVQLGVPAHHVGGRHKLPAAETFGLQEHELSPAGQVLLLDTERDGSRCSDQVDRSCSAQRRNSREPLNQFVGKNVNFGMRFWACSHQERPSGHFLWSQDLTSPQRWFTHWTKQTGGGANHF